MITQPTKSVHNYSISITLEPIKHVLITYHIYEQKEIGITTKHKLINA